MLLKEVLNKYPNSAIKVGANSAFVYCGENGDIASSFLSAYKSAKGETTNLLEREVVECFDSFAYFEPNTKIIQIVGEENGRYWTIEEFAKKLNKFKKQLAKQQA